MKTRELGLRTTVSLYGAVVEQSVSWRPGWFRGRRWQSVGRMLPGASEHGVARYRWTRSGEIELEPLAEGVQPSGPAVWSWQNGHGVDVSLDVIPMKRAQRRSSEQVGDLALLVMVLTLMVGVGQLNVLFRAVFGERVASTDAVMPSPELIARLLKEEFDGAETGAVAHVQRARHVRPSGSFYLPAGSSGDIDRPEGGEKVGPEVKRTPPSPDVGSAAVVGVQRQGAQPVEVPSVLLASDGVPMVPESVQPAVASGERGLPASVERFIGWGFHDWMDASSPQAAEIVEQLELARELMRLNPDEPYAILTVAYFAYLSENYALCRDLYGRYTELFPEDAAGWNNLALTHKRAGEYVQEERLYRVALSLDPNNANTQNNLAVNLAHQGRFAEAERLMDTLQASPEERPYANLHRAKIAAAQGKNRRAYRYLKEALDDVGSMDTLHHIEFRQDIRLDPALARLRARPRFRKLLEAAYGDDSPVRLGQNREPVSESADG